MAQVQLALLAAGFCLAAACSRDSSKIDGAFAAAALGGTVPAIVISLFLVILLSLPLCCGCGAEVLKRSSGLKIGIVVVAVILGCLCPAIPLIAGGGACGTVTEELCAECGDGCTPSEREGISALCNFGSFFAMYFGAFGFLAVVFGPMAAGLGCCICCGCCKMAPEKGPQTAVVGQPQTYGGAPA